MITAGFILEHTPTGCWVAVLLGCTSKMYLCFTRPRTQERAPRFISRPVLVPARLSAETGEQARGLGGCRLVCLRSALLSSSQPPHSISLYNFVPSA